MALKQESDLTSYGCPKCGWRIDLHRQKPPPATCLYCGKQLTLIGQSDPGAGLPIGIQVHNIELTPGSGGNTGTAHWMLDDGTTFVSLMQGRDRTARGRYRAVSILEGTSTSGPAKGWCVQALQAGAWTWIRSFQQSANFCEYTPIRAQLGRRGVLGCNVGSRATR